MKRQLSVHLFSFFTILLWASGFALTKIALSSFSANAVGFLRYAIASIILIPIVWIKKIPLPALRDIPLFFVTGAVGFFFYMITFNKGLETLSSATSSILIATAPILTALLAVLFLKESMRITSWVAIAIEFCGILVLTLWNGIFSVEIGILWTLAASLLISCYNILQRYLTRTYSPLQVTAYSIFAGTILLSFFSKEAISQIIQAPPAPLLAVIFMGIFPSALGYVFWSNALSLAQQTSTVTNYMFLTPFFSTLLGFLLIIEVPHLSTIVGGSIILFGLLLFRITQKQQ